MNKYRPRALGAPMRAVAAGIVVLVLVAGCVGDAGPSAGPRERQRLHVAGKPPSSGSDLPEATNLTWDELHGSRLVFAPDAGRWAVLRIRLTQAAMEPGSSDGSSFQIRYWYYMEAENATGAFEMSGFRFGSDAPFLDAY